MNDERWLNLFNDYANSSFVDALRRQSPHLLPGAGPRPETREAEAVVPWGTGGLPPSSAPASSTPGRRPGETRRSSSAKLEFE